MEKTKGVVLFAFGHYAYYWAMHNLALTIKHFNKNINITAFVGSQAEAKHRCPEIVNHIDTITEIPKELFYNNGKFDPGKLKVSLYDLLPYDINLYLDVDAICIKDIEPLFAELQAQGKQYMAHTVGYHTIDKGRHIESMQWAWADTIWEKYKLGQESVLPAINSSLQYIEKGKVAKKIYDTAKALYNDPIPVDKLRMKWGGGQPDELYMNIAFAKLNHDPACTPVGFDGAEQGHIHFAMRRNLEIKDVKERFYFQSYYGGAGFTARFYTEWIDRMLSKIIIENKLGTWYKIDYILKYKHASKK
jgi:hypothetical protein